MYEMVGFCPIHANLSKLKELFLHLKESGKKNRLKSVSSPVQSMEMEMILW